jgi:hypothetical protein
MRAFALGLLLIAYASETRASAPKFPYDAVVQADDVEVRSGPGTHYYPTGVLKKSDAVTVHRHDPGGWFMVSPPAGSFSYIDARLIQRQGDRGVVQVVPNEDGSLPRAIVRIGSQLGDDHKFYGRQLTNGDQVQVLGERTLTTDRGAVTMLMIAPPSREYRWVKGDFVIAADPSIREQKASDPYADPLVETGVRLPPPPELPAAPLAPPALPAVAEATPEPLSAPSREVKSSDVSGPSDGSSVASARLRMREIDGRYVDMVAKPPAEWDIIGIEDGYRAVIRSLPSGDPLVESLENRIGALAERRKIQEEFQEFVKLTSATSQRDAELAARQASPIVTQAGAIPTNPGAGMATDPAGNPLFSPELLGNAPNGQPSFTDGANGPALPVPGVVSPASTMNGPSIVTSSPEVMPVTPRGTQSQLVPTPASLVPPAPGVGTPGPTSMSFGGPAAGMSPAAGMGPAAGMSPSAPGPTGGVSPQLNGAGIVQRAPARPGSPPYMLTAPDGRFLTFLNAGPGVNLDAAVGQPMGVVGRRYFEPSVRAEMIVVRQMMPVQLQ